jgi:fimbrial chaperone protein
MFTHSITPAPTRDTSRRLARIGSALLAWGLMASAHADLMLFPTRVVFEKDQRAAQVELVNQGRGPETYRISLVNRRMGVFGDFNAVTAGQEPTAGELFADEMVKFSPRQVTIAPGTSQTVRILLRKPSDLPEGEYRSHLQFDRVPDASLNNSVEGSNPTAKDGGVGVVLSALVGASIPVIVRQGDTQAQVKLQGLSWAAPSKEGPASLSFDIERQGNRSVYGDIEVTARPAGSSSDLALGRATGVAVYVPNAQRKARLNLVLPEGVSLARGTVQVRYRERTEAGGQVIAENQITLP